MGEKVTAPDPSESWNGGSHRAAWQRVVMEHLSCWQRCTTDVGREWGTDGLFSLSPLPLALLEGDSYWPTPYRTCQGVRKPQWCSPQQWGSFRPRAGKDGEWIEGGTVAPTRILSQCLLTPGPMERGLECRYPRLAHTFLFLRYALLNMR